MSFGIAKASTGIYSKCASAAQKEERETVPKGKKGKIDKKATLFTGLGVFDAVGGVGLAAAAVFAYLGMVPVPPMFLAIPAGGILAIDGIALIATKAPCAKQE